MQKHGRQTDPTPEQKAHWSRVAKLGCIVTGSSVVTIHHIHGGSVVDELGFEHNPGGAERQNHWLVIPLHPRLHVGELGIDNGLGVYKSIAKWEVAHGTQVALLEEVCRRLQINVFKLAGINRKVPGLEG